MRSRRLSRLQFSREPLQINTIDNSVYFQKAIYAPDCGFPPEPVCRGLQSPVQTYRNRTGQNRREWQNGIRIHARLNRKPESRCTIHAVCADDISFSDAECKTEHWVHLSGSRRSKENVGKRYRRKSLGCEITTYAANIVVLSQQKRTAMLLTSSAPEIITHSRQTAFHT